MLATNPKNGSGAHPHNFLSSTFQKLMKFDIFGGCTSRDLFNFENSCGQVNRYFARSSLVSQYTPAIKSLQNVDIHTGSNFSNKMVQSDIQKSFFQYLKGPTQKASYIILDLLIERVPILKYQDGFLTRTIEFTKSKISLGKEIRINRDEHLELFRKLVPQLAHDLSIYKKVILHKALSRTQYVSTEQKLIKFSHTEEISATNEFLAALYEIIENSIPNLEVLYLDDFHAWEGHRWGLSSFHYEDGYYQQLNKKIRDITRKGQDV